MYHRLSQLICPNGLKNNPNKEMKSTDFITIHNTGNYNATANAKAHANLLYNGTGGSSWHYSVDNNEIWQSFEDNRQCWHAGDGNNGLGNATSIGIEICVNFGFMPKGITQAGVKSLDMATEKEKATAINEFIKACDNAAQLVADLLKKHNLTIDKVVQHNKWTGKNCPAEIRSGAWGVTWDSFLENVQHYMKENTPIVGMATATLAQMKQWAKNKGAEQYFIDLAYLFNQNAINAGIDPVVVYCQSAKETAYGRFGGVLDKSYCNPCGMKNSQGGGDYDPNAHMKFKSWSDGIRAQIDHLALYAGATGYPKAQSLDPRHFPYLLGTAKTVEELGGKWAPSKTYGSDIVKMMDEVKNTVIENPHQHELEEIPSHTCDISNPNEPSSWAKEAWDWAVDNKITDGTNPKQAATREQVVMLIYNAIKISGKS